MGALDLGARGHVTNVFEGQARLAIVLQARRREKVPQRVHLPSRVVECHVA